MKTEFMDHVEQVLARHGGKGFLSYLVYILVFLCLAGYVVGKPLFDLVTRNKLKLK